MRIELLAPHHDRQRFDCGEPALNDFLKHIAGQQQRRNVGKTFVAVSEADEATVLGFYTLSAGSIRHDNVPMALRKKLPKYPVPIVTLGRLAVDKTAQGTGIGAALLRDALLRVAAVAAKDIGIVAVVVDAKSSEARRFYQRYGFQALHDQPGTLFLPISVLTTAILTEK